MSAEDLGNDAEAFISHFGSPDSDYVNDQERPVPPMRMRLLEYKRARVRVVYTAGFEAKRPYRWRYVGMQDTITDAKISPEEATRRLRNR